MSDLTLLQLVEQAKVEGPCSQGHDWVSDGGRACDAWGNDEVPDCQGTQTVYKCTRCGNYDYGDHDGPGFEDCVVFCRRKT